MSSLSYSIHNVAGRRISYMDCKSLQNVLEDWFKFSGYDKDQKEFNLLSYGLMQHLNNERIDTLLNQ